VSGPMGGRLEQPFLVAATEGDLVNVAWGSNRGIEIQIAIMLATIGLIAAAAVRAGMVRDLETAGSLFSAFGFAVTLFILWIARLLSKRVRRARMGLLRRDDLRNRNHLIVTTNLCRSLALGAERSNAGSADALSAMRDIALHIGELSTTYEYLLTTQGKKLAESVRAAALFAIAGKSCATVDLSHMLAALSQLETEVLDIDSAELVRRREQEVDAEDSPRA